MLKINYKLYNNNNVQLLNMKTRLKCLHFLIKMLWERIIGWCLVTYVIVPEHVRFLKLYSFKFCSAAHRMSIINSVPPNTNMTLEGRELKLLSNLCLMPKLMSVWMKNKMYILHSCCKYVFSYLVHKCLLLPEITAALLLQLLILKFFFAVMYHSWIWVSYFIL